MSRRRKRVLIVVGCLALLGVGLLWALPEIIRRVALDQIPKRIGRAAAIGDIDLNLFTGRLAIKNFRLAEREGPEAFVAFERLDVRLSTVALLGSHLRLGEVRLVEPAIRVIRTGPGEFNFSDLLSKEPSPEGAPPSRWTLTAEGLAVSGGRVQINDRVFAAEAGWQVKDFKIEGAGITTRPGAPPGRLALHARIDNAVLDVTADPFRLEPLRTTVKLALDGFDMNRLNPYVYAPLGTPYMPKGGVLSLALSAQVDSDAEEVKRAVLSGTVNLRSQVMVPAGSEHPFLKSSRVSVDIKEADALSRQLTVASVEVEGLDLKARRDAQGVIDLLEMFKPRAVPKAAAAAPAPAAPGPPGSAVAPPAQPPRRLFPILQALARGFDRIKIERIDLAPSAFTFVDESVKPVTTLSITKFQARIDDLVWPPASPANVVLSTDMPGGGRLEIKGPVVAQPFDARVTMTVRDAPVTPYQAYIPVPAKLSGLYNGNSAHHVGYRDGVMIITSKGDSWAQNVEIRDPGAQRPLFRVDRMDLAGIDLDWPKRVSITRVGFQRLRAEIEREADGTINVRRLFTAPDAQQKPPPSERVAAPIPPPPKAVSQAPQPKGLLETMQIEFGEVRMDDGFLRFLDRTTQPAFSQDLSRLNLKVTGLGNRPGRRAKLALQGVVGGDAALNVSGEVGPIGAPAYVDVSGELRSFQLTSVVPYAVATTGWLVKQGDLQYKLHFKLEGDQITAENNIVVAKLQVAPASAGDEVKKRIGLPLELIVALIKDDQGLIQVNVPITGSISDPQFGLGDAIWTAVKNVLTNIVKAPFKAIGRLFSSGSSDKLEEPKVDPVVFASGSAELSPAMQEHLLRVADFLRRTPFVNLTLASVSTPADAAALRNELLTARLVAFQKERRLRDGAATLAAYYKARLPEVPMPKTTEEQLALLREREPVPDAALAELGRKRLQAVRERLLGGEGIQPTRLADMQEPPASTATAAAAEGRIEFGITAGG